MLPDIIKLRDELAKSNNHETSYLRGCLADLVKDKADRNLLNICITSGVLQDFFQEGSPDTFLIKRCRSKLIEDFFVSEAGANRAIFFCTLLRSEETELQLVPYRKGNKWGYCSPYKVIIIDCIYNSATPFNNGSAEVTIDNKMFNIDFNGNTRRIENYFAQNWLSEGLLMDEKNGKLGFTDINGSLIIPHKYDIDFGEWYKFSEGLAGVKIGNKWGYIDKTDKIILPFIYEDWKDLIEVSPCFDEGIVHVKKDGKWGFVDRLGKIVIPFVYDCINDSYTGKVFSNGLGNMAKNDKWGYIDRHGNVIIPFIYDSSAGFNEGFAKVSKEGKYGFIDKEGNVSIPFIYDYAYGFIEGFAVVTKDNKYGFIDKEGNIAIPFIYDYAASFSEGFAVVKKDNKYGFINNEGIVSIPCIYGGTDSFKDGLAKVFVNNTGIAKIATLEMKFIGYIDTKGTQYWED
jgi:hypothetical protein